MLRNLSLFSRACAVACLVLVLGSTALAQVTQTWQTNLLDSKDVSPESSPFMRPMAQDASGNYYICGENAAELYIAKYSSAGSLLMSLPKIYTSGSNVASSIAVDVNGDIYLGVNHPTNATPGFDVIKFNSAGQQVWDQNVASHTLLQIRAFPTGGVVVLSGYNNGNTHTAISRYDTNGNQLWLGDYFLAGSQNAFATDLSVASTGNIYVTGWNDNLSTSSVFVLGYSSTGTSLWTQSFGGAFNNLDRGVAVRVDPTGNVIVAGNKINTNDLIVLKYSSAGSLLWSCLDAVTGAGAAVCDDLSVDSSGNVSISGYIDNFSQALISRINSSGSVQWNSTYDGPTGQDEALLVNTDSSGNTYVGLRTNVNNADTAALAKYDTNGIQSWLTLTSTTGIMSPPRGIGFDGSGNPLLFGGEGDPGFLIANSSTGAIISNTRNDLMLQQMAGTANVSVVDSAGNTYTFSTAQANLPSLRGTFFTKTDPSGAVVWKKQFSNVYIDTAKMDASGNIVAGGTKLASPRSDFDGVVGKFDQTGAQLWGITFNDSSNRDDYVANMSLDATGAPSFLIGISNTTTTFAGRCDNAGANAWTTSGTFTGVAAGPDGSTYVCGNINHSGNPDIEAFKYDTSGVLVWAANYDGTIHGSDAALKIMVDSSGNAYILARTSQLITTAGTYDRVSVLKYSSAGPLLWQKLYSPGYVSSSHGAEDMDLDPNGGVAVEYDLGAADSTPAILKLDANGNQLWTRNFTYPLIYRGLRVSPGSDVYVFGNVNAGTWGFEKIRADGTPWPNVPPFFNGIFEVHNTPAANQTLEDLTWDQQGNLLLSGSLPFTTIIPEAALVKLALDPAMSQIVVTPNSVLGNSGATGKVVISLPAPSGGVTVTLLSSNPSAAAVPASVFIPQGQNLATFSITTANSGYSTFSVGITGAIGSDSLMGTLAVHPNNRASFISQTVPTSMIAGQTYPVSLVFKNTGTTTWDAAHAYQLYSANPYNNSNFHTNRIPLTSGSVAPSANGTFGMNIIAPNSSGTYNFQWQPYEGSDNMIFGQTSTAVAVTVTKVGDAARYISRTGVLTVNACADFWVQNTMMNVGTNTWTSSGGYHMVSVNPYKDPKWTAINLFMPANSSIATNSQVTFTGLCTAPLTPGTYTMQWSVDHNGVTFGDRSPLLSITVTQGPDDAQYVSMTPFSTSIAPSTTFGVTFTMTNLGTATWDSTYSLLSVGSNNFGVASIVSGSVAQNAQGTFTGSFTAPTTPGTYTFGFRMAHNTTKFGQPTPLTSIVVSADAAQYISRTGVLTVNAGQDFYVQNLFKDTGSTSWSTATGYSMMTVYPANNDATWTVTRGYLASGTIAPGATGTFTALCTAPFTPGSYKMQWQMDKSGTPFGEKSPLLTMTVNLGSDDVQFVSQTGVPTTIAHGTTFSATITMKNLGTATWGAGYTLTPIGSNDFGIASINAVSTAQNANDVFSATFTAPVTPGTYTFQMRMADGSTKFGQAATKVTITVT